VKPQLGNQQKMEGVLTLETVDGDGLRFAARIGDRTLVLDSSPGATDANPVQALLASIVSCSAMDVIDILRKKRQRVTAYEIHMSGERAKEHPRRFLSIACVHRLTGHGLDRQAAEHALELSLEKYCSVSHCLRPDLAVTHRIEILEA
jgi:putative redox protein